MVQGVVYKGICFWFAHPVNKICNSVASLEIQAATIVIDSSTVLFTEK